MSDRQVEQAQHAAHLEAAPAVLLAGGLDAALAVVSAVSGWHLFSDGDWWLWLVLGLPAIVVAIVFWSGMASLGVSRQHTRTVTIFLLGLLAAANLLGILLVIVSLLSGRSEMTGGQLLATAAVVLIVNQISFALIFWELDSGGPVVRSQADGRPTPDFQFPQDDNPGLATTGWKPTLGDYLYVALTNSIAFSPTDTMPLTHKAKVYMTFESVTSAITVLIVAARAVNVLQG